MTFTELIKEAFNGSENARIDVLNVCSNKMSLLTTILAEVCGGGENYSYTTKIEPIHPNEEDKDIIVGYMNIVTLKGSYDESCYDFVFDENYNCVEMGMTISED